MFHQFVHFFRIASRVAPHLTTHARVAEGRSVENDASTARVRAKDASHGGGASWHDLTRDEPCETRQSARRLANPVRKKQTLRQSSPRRAVALQHEVCTVAEFLGVIRKTVEAQWRSQDRRLVSLVSAMQRGAERINELKGQLVERLQQHAGEQIVDDPVPQNGKTPSAVSDCRPTGFDRGPQQGSAVQH